MKAILSLLSMLIIATAFAQAQGKTYSINEQPGNVIPGGIYLTDEDSAKVELRSLMDKPTLLAFVYYRCPGLCSPLMTGIGEMIEKSNFIPGDDYRVICISINNHETPQLARQKKTNQLKVLKKQITEGAWRFLTGDSASIATLTSLAGFEFEKVGNDYVHSAGLIVVSPSGTITQYLLGTFFLPHEMEWAVENALTGQPVASRIKTAKYCYPEEPKPRAITQMTIVWGAGMLIMAELVVVFLLVFRRRRFRRKGD